MPGTEKAIKKLEGRIVDMEKKFKKMEAAIKANAAEIVSKDKVASNWDRNCLLEISKIWKRLTKLEGRR